MINALGLLEVDGMVAAIDAADAMLKAANVRLLSHEVLNHWSLNAGGGRRSGGVSCGAGRRLCCRDAYRACHQPQGDRSARR